MKYLARFIHKISPCATDLVKDVEIPPGAIADRKKLGAALRAARLLQKGDRVGEFRLKGREIVVFPQGSIMLNHAIVLMPMATAEDRQAIVSNLEKEVEKVKAQEEHERVHFNTSRWQEKLADAERALAMVREL